MVPKTAYPDEEAWVAEMVRLQQLMLELQQRLEELQKAHPNAPFADDPDASNGEDEANEKEKGEGDAGNDDLRAEARELMRADDYWRDPHKQRRVAAIFKRLYPGTLRTAPLDFGEGV
jgi:hypothetical protein